jgi:hypothetical protein
VRVPIRVEIEPELLRAIQRAALERETTAEAIAVEVLEEWRREGTARERRSATSARTAAKLGQQYRNRSNKAPFGWRLVAGNSISVEARRDARQSLERNEAEARILRRMVRLRDRGLGAWRIANELNKYSRDRNPRTGRPWHYSTVGGILRTYDRRNALGIHEPPDEDRPKGNLTGYKMRAGCDGSGSEALHRIMVEALQDGEDPAEVFARVMAEPSAARTHLTKDRADPRAKWERKWEQELLDWQNGKRPPVVGSRDDAKALLRCAAQDVEDHPERWAGKAGATDREVLLALYRLAHDLGSVSGFEVSVRQLAELAKVSSKTAGKALLRLRNADNAGRFPYLEKLASLREGANVRTIGRYRLNFRREVRWMLRKAHANTHITAHPLRTVFDSQHPSGDAFRWGCLGPNAKRVLLFLQSVPNASGRAVAEATGLSPSTVSRILKKLANERK